MAPFVFELKKSVKIFLVALIKIKRIWPETDHLHPPPGLPEGGVIRGILLLFWNIFQIQMRLSLTTRLELHF